MKGVSGNGDALTIDTSIYSLEAIKKTAYRFADRASILIEPKTGNEVSAQFQFRDEAAHDQVIADFCNELLDQDLREIIKQETTHVRNLILAHAFSRTSLVDQG